MNKSFHKQRHKLMLLVLTAFHFSTSSCQPMRGYSLNCLKLQVTFFFSRHEEYTINYGNMLSTKANKLTNTRIHTHKSI